MVARGFLDPANLNNQSGAEPSIWYKAMTSPDTLRQRVTLALSEIFVINVAQINGAGGWKGFGSWPEQAWPAFEVEKNAK